MRDAATAIEEFGLTVKQFASLPVYIQDTLVDAKRRLDTQRATIETMDAVRPQDWLKVSSQPGLHVTTAEGTYVYPLKDWGHQGQVSLVFPEPGKRFNQRVEMRLDSEGEVTVSVQGSRVSIQPRASNTFILGFVD